MRDETAVLAGGLIPGWKRELLKHAQAGNRKAAAECANILLGLLIVKDQPHDR
jgi:hypothetical protein